MFSLLPVLIGILLALAAFAAIGWVLYGMEQAYRYHSLTSGYRSAVALQHMRTRLLVIESKAAAAHRDTPTPRLASLQCEIVSLLTEMENTP